MLRMTNLTFISNPKEHFYLRDEPKIRSDSGRQSGGEPAPIHARAGHVPVGSTCSAAGDGGQRWQALRRAGLLRLRWELLLRSPR